MSIETVRIIYCSTMTSSLDRESLTELVRTSVISNKKQHLTGILLFGEIYFFQVLEGKQQPLLKLLEKIKQDDRHKDIRSLSNRPIVKRLFPDWSMELIDGTDAFIKQVYGGRFNPYSFSASEALECATNAKAWRLRRLQKT